MNPNQPEKLVLRADRNRVPSAGDRANPGKLVADFGIASPQVSAIAFVILILSGFSAPHCGATVYQSNGSEASVRALLNAAHDGDTITLPAGTFSWTSRLDITKGITLKGQTTISGAGTATATANDVTIIQDDTPVGDNQKIILRASMTSATQCFRMTGITFVAGARPTKGTSDAAFQLHCIAASANKTMRIDNCHFNQLRQGRVIGAFGWVNGVADHNIIEIIPSGATFFITEATHGGRTLAHGAWADYPRYGTDNFFFIETNTVKRLNPTNNIKSMTDTLPGGSFVVRHNYIQDCIITNHGTEGGAARGGRACEVYDNIFNYTIYAGEAGGLRSGSTLWHDNVVTGVEPIRICSFHNFRETPARPHPIWGIADGTSPWDQNDTDGNGHFVQGDPPYTFYSGTDTSSVNSQGVIHDNATHTPPWTTDQWRGFSIHKLSGGPDAGLGSFIVSNTSNTITYNYYGASDANPHLIFNAGDTYEIHRVLFMMDQNGSGKSDLIVGTNPPINTTTGTASWAQPSREPCYSWNNVYTPNGQVYGFDANPAQPTTKINIDFFNLGGGFPADTTPSAVSTKYVAALNGVDYTGTFVYPHPLVTGAPAPTLSATPRSHQHLQKKEAKKLKKQKEAKKIRE